MNVDGYYNSLLSFIDKAVDEGFVSPNARRIIVSAPTAKQLVRELEVQRLCFEHIEIKLRSNSFELLMAGVCSGA